MQVSTSNEQFVTISSEQFLLGFVFLDILGM